MTMTPETDAIALLQDKIKTTYIRGQARLAEALGKHPNTIKRWHKMGEAPPHKRVGHEYLYSITEVMTWLDDQNAAMENPLHRPQKKQLLGDNGRPLQPKPQPKGLRKILKC